MNNEYFPQWMALAMQCFWILFGGAMLFEGHVGLGGFLTTLAIFRNSGSELSRIYIAYVKIQDAFTLLFI